MSIPVHNTPPDSRTNYILPQLAGEKITFPGWNGVFSILASAKQTNGGLAVKAGVSVLSDPPGFHWQEEAHDVFLVIKGFLKDKFDVHCVHDYPPPEFSDWLETENKLGEPLQPYYLRANTGPRWMAGGLLSRPFILAKSYMKFANVDHCLFVVEGKLKVEIEGSSGENVLRDRETVVISAGQGFKLDFASPFVKIFSVANGRGIETLIQQVGKPFEGFVLPDKVEEVDSDKLARVAKEIGVTIE
ncbi:hypothetical protein FOC1_g10008969 [Fusarium oxysporum f. sp. cubense race 1]|uniref:Cupin type-1 domain-containing protein n=1 Tax=Fusarium oxysporum f. sp. cubense (strain race 1) TaxID=1229664 RepID=N4UCD1_FUSC1|nr:hypothetical protein FOC1_g10008969 [Fusarium oxysporum f. sp. cubense race 1]